MHTVFTKDFLGNTSKQHQFTNFKVSIVDYNYKVSEEWHFHDKVHISSIIKGGNLESRRSEDIQVNPGRVMVYHQGEIHRNRFTEHPSKNLNIEFEENFFNDEVHFSHFKSDEKIAIEFLTIYFEILWNDDYSTQSIEQIVKSLFWNDRHEHKGSWIAQLKEILNDRWDEFPSLEDLSKELNIHPITIYKYFTQNSGMTLSEYMRKLKVKRAIDLVINTGSSLAEISFECGFSDQSHMNRLVKKYTGYTPGAIRLLA